MSRDSAAAARDVRRRLLRLLALMLFVGGLAVPFGSFTRDAALGASAGILAQIKGWFSSSDYSGQVYLFGITTGSGFDCLATEPVMFLPAGMLLVGLLAAFLPSVRGDSLGRALLLACGGAPAVLLLFLLVHGEVAGWHVVTYREGYWSWLAATVLLVALTATEPRPDPGHYEV